MNDEAVQPPAEGTRACARCGRPFLSHVPTAKFCTMVCRRKADKERQAERKRAARRGGRER